jgi:integrase
VASASPFRAEGRSFVDLDNGIFYRLAEGQRETNKRQPPVPIPPRLLAHLRRWHAKGIARDYVVEWNRLPVKSVKTAFRRAVTLAGLTGKITPHTLRHTAATVDRWEAAGFLGMSVQMLERVYDHHHAEHLQTATRAVGYRPRQSLVDPLVKRDRRLAVPAQHVEKAGGPGRTRTSNQTVMSGRL